MKLCIVVPFEPKIAVGLTLKTYWLFIVVPYYIKIGFSLMVDD